MKRKVLAFFTASVMAMTMPGQAVMASAVEFSAVAEEEASAPEEITDVAEPESVQEETVTEEEAAEDAVSVEEVSAEECQPEEALFTDVPEDCVEADVFSAGAEGDTDNIWLAGLRQGDGTWVFNDENAVVSVHTENLADTTYDEIQWQLGTYQQNSVNPEEYDFVPFEEEQTADTYAVSEDGTAITLYGNKLMEKLPKHFDIRVRVMMDGGEVSGTSFWVDIRQAVYDYRLPHKEGISSLPGWEHWIDRRTNVYIENGEYPWGSNMETEIVSVTAKDSTDTGEIVSLNADENGWNIRAENMGHAEVTVEYKTVAGENDAYIFDVFVSGDAYEVNVDSSTGTDNLLPGQSLNLSASVIRRCFNSETGEYSDGSTDALQLSWEYDEAQTAFGMTNEADGSLTVTANEEVNPEENIETIVRAVYSLDSVEVGSFEYRLYIRGGYHVLEMENLNDGIWEYYGTREVAPALKWFDTEHVTGTEIANVRYRLEWDENVFSITDSEGNNLANTEEGRYGTAPFDIRRISMDGSDIRVIAELPDEEGNYGEVSRKEFWIDGIDYWTYFEGENLRQGEGYTWVYNDEDLHIALNTDNLEGHDTSAVQIEWTAGLWDDELGSIGTELQESLNLYTIDDDGRGITLHGAALWKNRTSLRDECNFNVEAKVLVNEELVSVAGFGADVREPRCDIDEWEEDVLPGYMRVFENNTMGCYIENKDYPYGHDLRLEVTNVTAENEDAGAENPVLIAERDANNNNFWTIRTNDYGTGKVTITTSSTELGEREFVVYKYVVSDIYRADIGISPYHVMLPGESAVIKPVVRHYFEDKPGETLTEDSYTVEYRDYNTDLFELNQDGVNAVITAKAGEEEWYGDTGMTIRICIPLGETETYDIWEHRDFGVYSVYERAEGESLITEPGAVVKVEDLNPVLKRYSTENPAGETVGAEFFFEWLPDFFEMNETGTAFTVRADVVSEADDPMECRIGIAAVRPGQEGEPEEARYQSEVNITVCSHREKTTIVLPTCTEQGKTIISCEKCGKMISTTMQDAKGHDWDEGKVTKEPTCTAEGVKTFTCKSCGGIYTEPVGKTDHIIITIKDSDSTCTEPGKSHTECAVCHGEKTPPADMPVKPHTIVTVKDSDSTCTEPGKSHTECGVCHGEKTPLPDVPAKGHTFGEYAVTKEATALAAGEETRICTVCNGAETRVVPKLKATIKVNATTIPLKLRQTLTAFKVTGLAKGDYVKSWKSSNTRLVKVSGKRNGTCKLVAQKKTGKAKITITLASGLKKTIRVNVQKTDVRTTRITGITRTAKVRRGRTLALKPILTPISSREKVTYKSSNTKVATVSSKGVVKGRKKGKAVITVKSGRKTVKCTVTVK